jgi:drug/metabolite transporter (DMT)-like permease
LDRLPWSRWHWLIVIGLGTVWILGDTVLAFSLGAALMLAAGLVAAFLGVNAERRKLEDVATPLSAESAAREPSLAQR